MLLSDVVTVVRRYEAGNFAPTSPKERHQAIKPLKTNEKVFFFQILGNEDSHLRVMRK